MNELRERPDFLNLMFIEFVEFRSEYIPLLYERIFPRGLEVVQGFVERQNGLRSIPTDVMLRAFLGLIFSLVISQALLVEQIENIGSEGEISHYVDIFLHGVLEEAQP